MKYFVVLANGQKFGPADIHTLQQWVNEGRILPNTMLEEELTGNKMLASALPGIMFAAQAATPPNWSQPPSGSPYPRQPGTYGADIGQSDLTVAWVMGALGLVCCFIFAIIGLVYANKAKQKGNPGGQAAWIFNLVVLILAAVGTIFYFAMIPAMMRFGP